MPTLDSSHELALPFGVPGFRGVAQLNISCRIQQARLANNHGSPGSSPKPGSRHPGLLARQNYSSRSFGTSSIQRLKAPATAIYASESLSAVVCTPSLTVLFPYVEQRQGRLPPTVE